MSLLCSIICSVVSWAAVTILAVNPCCAAAAGLRGVAPDFDLSPVRESEPALANVGASQAGARERVGPADELAIAAVGGAADATPGSRGAAMFRSILLPGYGQLYNGQPTKGAMFLGTELALLSTALAFHLAGDSILSVYSRESRAQVGAGSNLRYQEMYDSAQIRYRVRDGLLVAASVVWALNIIEAYVSGGRGRPLLDMGGRQASQDRALAPLVAIRPGFAMFGFQGRF